jgi:hypothetical protein
MKYYINYSKTNYSKTSYYETKYYNFNRSDRTKTYIESLLCRDSLNSTNLFILYLLNQKVELK